MADDNLKGFDSLLADLEKLPLHVAQVLIPRALRKASEPIQAEMVRLAPDDPETPGSRIAQNIGVTVTEATATGAIALIGPTRKAFFAGFGEFGTKHQPRRPFLAPAFDSKMEEAVEILGEVLGEGIEKELKKL